MTGETTPAFGENSPLPDETRLTYETFDAVGELCDAWVRSGDTFAVDENGEHHRVSRTRSEEITEERFTLEYNPAMVSTAYDSQGREVKYAATAAFNAYVPRYRRPHTGLERLMMELPPDALVYSPKPDPAAKYPHPAGITPLGIRLNEIPGVRNIVKNAYSSPPRGEVRFPRGALVLGLPDKRLFLEFFDAVLTPPKPEEIESAPHLPAPRAAVPPQPQKAADPQKPAAAPAAQRPAPAVRPAQPQSIAQHPQTNRWGLDEEWRRTSKAVAYLLSVACAINLGMTVQAQIDARAYGSDIDPTKEYLLSAVLGLLAVIGFMASKKD